ncbi:PMP-22/EMP/MP20/Claudin tight junction [Fasciola hepatica]|uniref:PMP-22/EMP/MP20/Claudin tight junction n=1 Tax=Fasciola hepatica TaxID=6192 RepID=A0A4E0RUJ9_FASHE|nr:PMP-22/EMP/MP20/Claudin tight junction [Fasciola hepatica]
MRIKHRIKHSPFSEWRYYLGCTLSFTTFGVCIMCFVTPYWLQSWSRLHTPFQRLGLWEFCLKGYIQRLDTNMVSYYDCWWILSPYYSAIFPNLVPFWFLIIQVLMSIALALQVVLFVLLIVYLCERIRHVERRAFALRMMCVGHSLTVCAIFPSVLVFGINYTDPDWMPQPKFNWPSWSFGLAILSGFGALFSALCFGLMDREMRRDLQDWMLDFPMSTRVKHRRRWQLRHRHWSEDADSPPAVKPTQPESARIPESLMMSEFSEVAPSNMRPFSGSESISDSQLTEVVSGSRTPTNNNVTSQGSEV